MADNVQYICKFDALSHQQHSRGGLPFSFLLAGFRSKLDIGRASVVFYIIVGESLERNVSLVCTSGLENSLLH